MSRNRVQIGGARERKGDDFLLAWCLAFSGSGVLNRGSGCGYIWLRVVLVGLSGMPVKNCGWGEPPTT